MNKLLIQWEKSVESLISLYRLKIILLQDKVITVLDFEPNSNTSTNHSLL